MELNEADYFGGTPIDGYGPGFFRIAGEAHEGAILLLPNGLTEWTGFDAAPIVAASDQIDIILVGTGPEMPYYLPQDFRAAVEAADIGIEVMASPQACRTFTVRLGEGRRVGAALLPA